MKYLGTFKECSGELIKGKYYLVYGQYPNNGGSVSYVGVGYHLNHDSYNEEFAYRRSGDVGDMEVEFRRKDEPDSIDDDDVLYNDIDDIWLLNDNEVAQILMMEVGF